MAPPDSRFIGTATPNTFAMILHVYLVDSMLREVHPSYSSTVAALAEGKHRYQQAAGKFYCDCTKNNNACGATTQIDCANLGGEWVSTSRTKNPKTGVEQDNYPLLVPRWRSSSYVDEQGVAQPNNKKVGDKSYINVNLKFTYVEWEDTNQGNKQRLSRDECMPLVIASPNNFPTPKERKLGSIVYEPAYATVVAAQNPTN